MINKQNLWFITLFSLILILGIYYVSMPENTLNVFSENNESQNVNSEVLESDIIIAMKVEDEEKVLKQMEDARKILIDATASADQKNNAYETLQLLNEQKGKILEIENKIKEKFNLDSYIKIDGNKINVTIQAKDEGKKYANNIIKEVQSLYENQMYITVKFSS